jgi:ribosomal protein S6
LAKQKEQPKKQATQPKSNTGNDTGAGYVFTYLTRNVLIITAFAIVFFAIMKMNEGQSKLQGLYQEFQQLQESRDASNAPRAQEVYNEIMALQADTGMIKKLTRGYYWALNVNAKENVKNIEQIQEQYAREGKPLTREEKLRIRGGLYSLIEYINKNTPDTAVIILPPYDSLGGKSQYDFIYDPEWAEYYLYPRLCVSDHPRLKNAELNARATHVLVLEGWGYSKLKYDVPEAQRPREAILPINNPPVQTNPNP